MKLFDKLQMIKMNLVTYLTSINENINWVEFLNKYGTYDDAKILKRIRSLTWIDKDYEYMDTTSNMNYFEYYTNLINKFMPVLKQKVYILLPNNENDLIDEFIDELNLKVKVLHRLFDIYGIEYEDIDKVNGNEKIIIPTGSIAFKEPSKMFSGFSGLIIPDDYYNICFNESDELLNKIILTIESMRKSNLDVDELMKKNYGMLKLK